MIVPEKAAALTAQFYEWEMLGRGWLHADNPIDLEPPFTPFFGHSLRTGTPPVDDGLHHTLLSSIASAFKRKPVPVALPERPGVSYDLYPFENNDELIAIQLLFSRQTKSSLADAEQFLSMLSYCTSPVSFEIIANATAITIQLVCRESDTHYVKSQAMAYFKGVALKETVITGQELILEESSFATIDFGLEEEFMRPLGQSKTVADSFTSFFSILEQLEEGEQVIFQVLMNGTLNHWNGSIIQSVSNWDGTAFFEDAPEMLPLAKEKNAGTILAATIRLLVQTPDLEDAFSLLRKLIFVLINSSKSAYNKLLPLSNESYTIEQRITDIIYRESHRCGMLLNVKELTTFVHVPDFTLITKKLIGEIRKTKAAPAITEGHVFRLGLNTHNGIEKEVSLSSKQRLQHTHIIGATGTGKSTLLEAMIRQDIEKGEGVAVLDPHGDLIEAIMKGIPENRAGNVILVDPSDVYFPVGLNILKAHSDIEKEVLASDLVSSFRKFSTSWGDQMNSVFANAILAFLESNRGGTLIDLRRFLVEKPFRDEYLSMVHDPSIIYYWQKEYPLLKTSSIGPILTRLDAFLRPRLIRNMVAQEEGIDFEKVLNQKKIILVKLSQGLIGTENSYLLGSFVLSKIHQAALARQVSADRPNFYVYVDEFQHFTTPSMTHMLSGVRKYNVGLILAHQDLQQLQKSDSDLLNTLLTNAGTRICFRTGETDAKKLAEGFSTFEATDLQNLGRGEAIVRVEKPEYDFSLTVIPFSANGKSYTDVEEVILSSRAYNSSPRSEVEDELYSRLSIDQIYGGSEESNTKQTPKPRETNKENTKQSDTTTQKSERREVISKEETESVVKKTQETQHRYLQNLIKKMAESKGYKAIIEMPTPDGKGSVDVSIEGYSKRIACEVSVTTDVSWELHNIEKCLHAGYDAVFVCCTDKKFISQLIEKVKNCIPRTQLNRITITEPEGLFEFLDHHSVQQKTTETTMKGYRVKVEYDSLSQVEQKRKQESVAKIVMDSLRKMKR